MSIIHIEFVVDREVIESVLPVLIAAAESLQGRTAIKIELPPDSEDMISSWQESLAEMLGQDLGNLLSLLQNPGLAEGTIAVDDTVAEGVMRSCSAVRLRIRDTFLSEISDRHLQRGRLNPGKLALEQRRAYFCYLLLAELQAAIIVALDPTLLDEPN